ncbi:MAG TPA: efflux RND transporter periplasmic adaptor subunit [Gemmatimonadaceae bacterium]|nr:efflux RND transporter periplasmic adaptor subunit [Gemmatimonadaceae bacterium]
MLESRVNAPLGGAAIADAATTTSVRSDGAMPSPGVARGDVAATLGLASAPNHRRRQLARVLRWSVPVLVILGVTLFFWLRRAPEARVYQLSAARRGDLTVTVTATGALAPLDTVYVGTEVSGVVDVVTADYNDRVVKGQVLAVVNTDQLRAQIQQSRASLAVARAAVQQAAATLAETVPQAARAESLFKRAMISPQDVESARAARARADAAHASAIAQVAGAEAALEVQQTALRKATIRAPISGIVLERDVERGRTVTAAFQTPVLFVLAADLARMTLSLDIDEADIGQVAVGQTAEFSVDAYPDRVFTANVRSVRNAAKTVEGVVTYQAILDVANPELLLRPGMTATARIATAKVANALLVPNAALRFTPEAEGEGEGAGAPSTVTGEAAPPATGRSRRVWTLHHGALTAIPVTVGLTDGQLTEVTGGDLASGAQLVVGAGDESAAAAGPAQASTVEGHPPVLMGGRRGR